MHTGAPGEKISSRILLAQGGDSFHIIFYKNHGCLAFSADFRLFICLLCFASRRPSGAEAAGTSGAVHGAVHALSLAKQQLQGDLQVFGCKPSCLPCCQQTPQTAYFSI